MNDNLFNFFLDNLTITDYPLISSTLIKDISHLNSFTNQTQIIEASNRFLSILLDNKRALISLAFFNLVQTDLKRFHKISIKIIFISNSNTVSIISNVILEVYIKHKDNSFQLPPFNSFLNFVFKLPDLLSNFFQSSFINYSNYYLTLCESLISNRIVTMPSVLTKMFQLKFASFIYEAFKQKPHSKEAVNDYVNGISSQHCLYSSYFVKGLLLTEVKTINDINNLLPAYQGVLVDNNCNGLFDKIEKIIRRNASCITMVLLAINENKALGNKYFESILVLLRDRNRLFIEDVSTYDFYLVIFSIYLVIENDNTFDHVNVFDSIMKIILIVCEVSPDLNKKGIAQILMQDLQKKMQLYIQNHKSAQSKPPSHEVNKEEEEEENTSCLSPSQKEFLSFEANARNFSQSPSFFLNTNQFQIDFERIVLHNEPSKSSKPNKGPITKPKTKYKSIKFQKKYGVYEGNSQNKSPTLEICKENELGEFKHELKLPNTSSKLKISLNEEDKYDDLNKLKQPLYIKDCIIGLNSQYKDRQLLTLQHLPYLIDLQPLDLDFALKDLCSSLLRLPNNFDSECFDDLVELSLVKLTKYSPNQMTLLFCETFFQSTNNCGLKLKFLILNVLDRSVEELSEYNQKNKVPKANQFHVYFLNVILPLLNYLKKSKIESLIVFGDFDHLLTKFLFLISKMLLCSQNHPLIYKVLFETYDLFKAVIRDSFLKTMTHSLLEALNAYCDVLISFYNESFILIYPEYLSKVKEAVIFLNGLLDNKALNDDLHFKILKTLNSYVVNADKFKLNYFGIDREKVALI